MNDGDLAANISLLFAAGGHMHLLFAAGAPSSAIPMLQGCMQRHLMLAAQCADRFGKVQSKLMSLPVPCRL